MRKLLILLALMTAVACAQTNPAKPKQAAVPVDVVPVDKEPAHKLVFENEYVRVFSVEVAPHSETKYHQHDRDYVGVILGDAEVESVRVGEAAVRVQLKDGETRFTKGGFAHKAVNKGDKPFRNVTVEWKGKSFDPVMCTSYNDKCRHQFKYRGRIIGARQKLFSNTFGVEHFELTVDEAAVSVPFIATHVESKVLLIPVTGLTASIDAKRREFEPGEVVWADRDPEVAVHEGKGKREWVILTFWGPERAPKSKKQGPSRPKEGALDDKAKGAVGK